MSWRGMEKLHGKIAFRHNLANELPVNWVFSYKFKSWASRVKFPHRITIPSSCFGSEMRAKNAKNHDCNCRARLSSFFILSPFIDLRNKFENSFESQLHRSSQKARQGKFNRREILRHSSNRLIEARSIICHISRASEAIASDCVASEVVSS